MSRYFFASMLAVSALLVVGTIGNCVPSTDMQDFPSSRAGWGLTGHDVTGDGKIDLVTSHREDGGELWRNDYAGGVFDATAIQDLVAGWECKFGPMVPNSPWYLAMASSYGTYVHHNLTLYEVDEFNGNLEPTARYELYRMDYISWGRINTYDNYLDLVGTDYNSSPYVRIYNGNSDGTLDLSGSFSCGTGTDPDQIALAPMN
jgi:hypothetical protein